MRFYKIADGRRFAEDIQWQMAWSSSRMVLIDDEGKFAALSLWKRDWEDIFEDIEAILK